MKRIFLLLSMTLILGAGMSSCADEASEVQPEPQFNSVATETDGKSTEVPKDRN